MNCKCGKAIKINSTIKSRVRREPYEYWCSCGVMTSITADDLKEYTDKRLSNVPLKVRKKK